MFHVTTLDGRSAFIGRPSTFTAIAEWARALCHAVFGPVEGEAHYRKLPAKAVLELWALQVVSEG